MSRAPELSVVLPCYNESRGLKSILDRYADVGAGENFELILVDNGSTDETPRVLERLLRDYNFARSVRVEINQGYGHGLFTGLQAAEGELLCWSHADLQTDPGDVFRALAIYRRSADPQRTMVKGQRFGRRWSEQFVSWSMQTVSTLFFCMRMQEINAQPKLFHRDLLAYLSQPPKDFNFDVYVLFKALRHGWRVESFPVKFPPRQYGVSNWASTWRSKFRTMRRSMVYMLRLSWAQQ
jgi:glycosyltransferase involved in cell wall biosynthesis